MFALKYLIEIESFSLNVNIPLLRKQIAVRPLSVVRALVIVFNIFFFARLFGLPEQNTVVSVLLLICRALVVTLDLMDLQMTCFGSDDLSSSDHLDDRVLLGLYGMKYILRLLTTCVIYLENQSAGQALFTLGIVLTASRVMNAVISKYLVAKQLKAIRALAESASFLDRVVYDVREVIRCDHEIIRAYGVFAGTTAVFSYLRCILFCYRAWIVFGLGEHIDDAFEGHKSSTFIFSIAVCSPSVLLGFYCSLVSDEIEEVKFELVITMTARNSSKRQQKLISLLLRELHINRGHLSPLGLFSISRASLAAVIATSVSYMLVLIQFS